MIIKNNAHKNWLTVGLIAAALSVSACGKKDEPPVETAPAVDAQTPVEENATGVATANSSDDVAVASADGSTSGNANEAMATGENDDVAIATAGGDSDADVIDGTEREEHISTY